jgi:hypothetical protein
LYFLPAILKIEVPHEAILIAFTKEGTDYERGAAELQVKSHLQSAETAGGAARTACLKKVDSV